MGQVLCHKISCLHVISLLILATANVVSAFAPGRTTFHRRINDNKSYLKTPISTNQLVSQSSSSTSLYLLNRLFRRGKKEQKTPEEIVLVEQDLKPQEGPKKAKSKDSNIEGKKYIIENSSSMYYMLDFKALTWLVWLFLIAEVDLVVIGAGVSGLTAALTAAESSKKIKKSVVLEASDKVGGRVTSDKTSDGYILDRGFAVFIEEYPTAKQVLNLTELELKPFLPGALVKIPKKNFRIGFDEFERVADPLRQPLDIFTALFADVGTISDKFRVLSLIAHVNFNTVEELFKEPETDTLTCLNEKYGFSDKV